MPNDIIYSTVTAAPILDAEVAEAALAGLLAKRKTLPPKLFYDREGCRLFYKITELPEYYLTRAEQKPLAAAAAYLQESLPAGTCLVEYGASDETKALTLLRCTDRTGRALFSTYVPIDVAEPSLIEVSARLATTMPMLSVRPIRADFNRDVALPEDVMGRVGVGFFPGSTIGNLEPDQAMAFLRRVHGALGMGAHFLLGADLRKDPALLLPAYDDSAGVTAAFNLNLLVRLNREAGADFDVAAFRHRAVWNDRESRIEMHLVSQRDQVVRVAGILIGFTEGETIHTENSYKHPPERVRALAREAGWQPVKMWTDEAGLFGVYLFDRNG